MYSDLLKVISEHAKMSFRRIYCSKKNTKKLKEIVSLFFFFCATKSYEHPVPLSEGSIAYSCNNISFIYFIAR